MHGSSLTGWLMVALCGSAGGYCLVRMAGAASSEHHAAGQDALMGLGMALMALPVGGHVGWTAGICAVVFGAAAVRTSLPRRAAANPHHAVGTLAMLYMALAMLSGGHGGAGLPVVTGTLLVYYLAYALCMGMMLVAGGGASALTNGGVAVKRSGLRPIATPIAGCRVCMAIGMTAMLLGL